MVRDACFQLRQRREWRWRKVVALAHGWLVEGLLLSASPARPAILGRECWYQQPNQARMGGEEEVEEEEEEEMVVAEEEEEQEGKELRVQLMWPTQSPACQNLHSRNHLSVVRLAKACWPGRAGQEQRVSCELWNEKYTKCKDNQKSGKN